MSMVNFWNGPKANYNAEIHKNGIYQCTDTGDTYMFGSLNSGIEVPDNLITSSQVSDVMIASSLPPSPNRNTLYLIFPEADDILSGEDTLE